MIYELSEIFACISPVALDSGLIDVPNMSNDLDSINSLIAPFASGTSATCNFTSLFQQGSGFGLTTPWSNFTRWVAWMDMLANPGFGRYNPFLKALQDMLCCQPQNVSITVNNVPGLTCVGPGPSMGCTSFVTGSFSGSVDFNVGDFGDPSAFDYVALAFNCEGIDIHTIPNFQIGYIVHELGHVWDAITGQPRSEVHPYILQANYFWSIFGGGIFTVPCKDLRFMNSFPSYDCNTVVSNLKLNSGATPPLLPPVGTPCC